MAGAFSLRRGFSFAGGNILPPEQVKFQKRHDIIDNESLWKIKQKSYWEKERNTIDHADTTRITLFTALHRPQRLSGLQIPGWRMEI